MRATRPLQPGPLRGQNTGLRRKLDGMRAERDEYKRAADALARALNLLTIENGTLRRQIDRMREREMPGRLIPVACPRQRRRRLPQANETGEGASSHPVRQQAAVPSRMNLHKNCFRHVI